MVRLLLLSVATLMVLGARNTQAENTTTTTSAPPTPPPPPPYRNTWKVYNPLTRTPCIIFDANVTVAVKYEIKDPVTNKTWRSDYINVEVPREAVSSPDSSCSFTDAKYNVTAQLLRVLFVPEFPDVGGDEWSLSLFFTDNNKVNGGKAYGLYRIDLNVFYDSTIVFNNTANTTETFSSDNKTTFGGVIGASANRSAKCSTADLQITEFAKVHLNTFQVQAYGKNDTFLEAELCDHDVRTSDIVPIVVGACLAALVIIVLVAYLIGRARAKRQGYASV